MSGNSIIKGDAVAEALLVLIRDLNTLMSERWDDKPELEVRKRITRAIAQSLDVAI